MIMMVEIIVCVTEELVLYQYDNSPYLLEAGITGRAPFCRCVVPLKWTAFTPMRDSSKTAREQRGGFRG